MVRVFDKGNQTRGTQRIEFSTAVQRGYGSVCEHSDVYCHTCRVGSASVFAVRVFLLFRLGAALGGQLHALFDGRFDFEILVGLDLGLASDVRQDVMVRDVHGDRAAHAQRRTGSGIRFARIVGILLGELAVDRIENRLRQRIRQFDFVRIFVLKTSLGLRGVDRKSVV